MIRQTRNGILVGVVVGLTLACGGNGSPTSPDRTSAPAAAATPPPPPTPTPQPPPAQSSPMSFKVDGTSTAAGSVTAGMAGGILSVGGTDASRSTTLSFALTPTAAGTGTYVLGPSSAANTMILIGNPAAGWQAGVGIGGGTITITTLTSTSASGNFSFTLTAVPGTGATGTKTISEGAFNVTLRGPRRQHQRQVAVPQ